jgi:hypothetical protein
MPPVLPITKTQACNPTSVCGGQNNGAYAHVLDAIRFQYLGSDGQQHVPVDEAVPEHGTVRFKRLGRDPVANLFHRPVHNRNLVDFGRWIGKMR